MVTVIINGKKYQAEEGRKLLQVALDNGIEIPHLCYHENLSPYGGCRLCLVELVGKKKSSLVTSCTLPVSEGLEVKTDTPQVKRARRLVMEMILSQAPDSLRIQALARELGVSASSFPSDGDGCIRCGLCVRACEELVGAGAISFANRGYARTVEPPFAEEPKSCIGCGTCVVICPTDCIKMEERDGERKIIRWKRNLKMKSCVRCGRPFLPLAMVDFIAKRSTNPPSEEWFDLCPDCR